MPFAKSTQHGGNEALEKRISFTARLDHAVHVYELRSAKYLGKVDTLDIDLDPWQPSLYALLEERFPAEVDILERLSGER